MTVIPTSIKNIGSKKHSKAEKIRDLSLKKKKRLNKIAKYVSVIIQKKKNWFSLSNILNIVSIFLILGSFFPRTDGFFPSAEKSILDCKTFNISRACDQQKALYYGKWHLMIYLANNILSFKEIFKNKETADFFEGFSTKTTFNVIMYGPSGTGKTAFVRKFSYYLDFKLRFFYAKNQYEKENKNLKFSNLPVKTQIKLTDALDNLIYIVFVDPASVFDRFVGGSEAKIKELFSLSTFLKENEAIIYFFDEVDAFCSKRGNDKQDYLIGMKNQLLSLLDGGENGSNKTINAFVFSATNRFDAVDEAFLRRFEIKAHFALPDENERIFLLKKFLPEYSCFFTEEDFSKFSDLFKGFSHAEIKSCVTRFKIFFLGKNCKHKKILFETLRAMSKCIKSSSDSKENKFDFKNDPYVKNHELDFIDKKILEIEKKDL